DFTIVTVSNTAGMGIWIDWNNDMVFDAAEQVYASGGYTATGSGSFTIPAGQAVGNYRMRVVANYLTTTPTPCGDLGYATYGEAEDYTVTVTPPPACMPPTGLTVSNISSSGADLSWTASSSNPGDGYEWNVLDQGNFLVASGTTAAGVTTASATGLSANTDYQLFVRAICDDSNSSTWAGPEAFFTGYCPVTSTSTTYGISNFVTTGGVTNISNPSTGGSYNDYTAQSVSSWVGTAIGFTITSASGTAGMAIWIDWNNDLVFDAAERVYNAGTYVSSGTGSFTIPAGQALGNYRMRVVANWSATTPTPCGDLGSQAYGEAEDYTVQVVAPPPCTAPLGVAVTLTSATSATLTWTDNTAESYNYEVTTGSTTVYSGNVASGTPAIVLDPLAGNTTFTVKVQSVCDGGATLSDWSLNVNFTTPIVVPAPWFEPFATTSTPTGWTTTGWTLGSTRGVTGNPGNNIYKNIYSASTSGTSFTTVSVGPVTAAMSLGFDYKASLFSSPYNPPAAGSGNYVVAISTDFGGTWTTLETVTNDAVAGWRSKSYPLTAYAGQYIKVRITGNWVNGDWDYGFDNFKIESCPVPTALAVSNLTGTSADFSWTSGVGNFEWEMRTGGTTVVDDGSTAANTASSTSLTPNTSYGLYVRAICGVGDTSAWAGPVSFTTPCNAVTTFTENFDGVTTPAFPACWAKVGTTGSANTQTSNPASAHGADACGFQPRRRHPLVPLQHAGERHPWRRGADRLPDQPG
ncbi:MAG TPA: GEVED domain-containing protein, partial [Flavobacteriales bacterium]|nr:GEVED domain-containing protein [Flavobacteriales bacterium]